MGARLDLRERGMFWVGPALTLATIGLGHVLWRTIFPEAALIPGAAFAPVFLAAVLATFLGGRASGLVGATIATTYVGYLLAAAPSLTTLARALLIVTTLYASVLIVGRLKAKADVTLENERATADRERRNVAEARQAIEVLRANNETLETFVYVITHDLKEPVRAIEHHIRQAQAHEGTSDGQTDIAEALETNRRLGILLQRLLEYSRASLTPPTVRPLTISEVLGDAVCRPIYEFTLLTRKARLELPEDSPAFLADPTLLGQAIGNIVLNAIKHNQRDSPRVSIIIRPAGGESIDILIQDDGPGFPPALLQRFQKLRSNRPATLAGGFGLVIARRAMERLGGSMSIANLSEGSEVRLRLPRASVGSAPATLVVHPDRARAVPVKAPP